MKPKNTRKDLLLPDGAPTRCGFVSFGMGLFEDCETNATVQLSEGQKERLQTWYLEHPKHIVEVSSYGYLCDVHEKLIHSLIGSEP
jgi:hypothetical protein